MSGGCLSDSGYCLGGYDMQAIDKHLIRLIFISFFLFSLLPRIGQNVAYIGVSVGCLEGVWKVSGRCLEAVWKVSGSCLERVWKMSGSCLDGVCKVSGRFPKGVWNMSGMCLEGV